LKRKIETIYLFIGQKMFR